MKPMLLFYSFTQKNKKREKYYKWFKEKLFTKCLFE